ncbi:MAG: IS30 family transposase [bacterium]|nr:IS30 family transposase [bacterium]
MEQVKNTNYRHLQKADRQEIKHYLDKGYSHRDIGKLLMRSPNSISREIKKNSTKGVYDPEKAQDKSRNRRKNSKYQGMKIAADPALRNYVEEKIRTYWSPENISDRIRHIEKHLKYVSAKGIYKFLFGSHGGSLPGFLFYKGKVRKTGRHSKVTQLQDRVFIDNRPKSIGERRYFGDWEGDFIVSGRNGKGVLLVLYERKSKYFIMKRFMVQRIETIHQYILEVTGGVIMNSLTLDNDIVFKKHKQLSEIIGKPIYFCHPYHSWEKGGVENTNKLIRRFVTKGSDISKYTEEYLRMVQDILNNKPRRCLKAKTPYEVMTENDQFIPNQEIKLDDIIKSKVKIK